MTKEFLNRSERLLYLHRRELLTLAVGMTAGSIVPSVTPPEAALVEPARSASTTAEVSPLNVSAATARRLLDIARRNELRREVDLPLLSIPKELRRLKERDDNQKFSEAFRPFEAANRQAVWDQVLKSRREAEGNPHWRPRCWSEGVGYQSEVYRLLRDRFRAEAPGAFDWKNTEGLQ